MAPQADTPPDLTDDFIAGIFHILDTELNSKILFALLYGIYTGILAITLWNIFIKKCWPLRRAMVILIIVLHALITISFALDWLYVHSAFIENGQSFWTVYLRLGTNKQAVILEAIAASMSTILTDSYMIWCCWMVWGRRWPVVLFPILSLVFATVSKIITALLLYLGNINTSTGIFLMLYLSFVLATTLWCTFLIIYRILTIAGVKRGANGRSRVYQHFLEALVESSALYSIFLVVYLALAICKDSREYYFDVMATITKGVAPTLIVGRCTTRHRARPDNSWQGSVIGSASIRSQEQEHSRASFREDDRTSPMLNGDLEAQRGSSVREPSPTLRSVSVVADYVHANTDVSPEASPHTRSRSLLHDRSSLYEDATHDSTVAADEATALHR
ncbi:hypothetical protein IW262DRAFT_992515 [Armillaria fumosa]|nr:hypothetical protein IW262DRAFT_992515 [Armillaria fumosa]